MLQIRALGQALERNGTGKQIYVGVEIMSQWSIMLISSFSSS